MSSFNHSSIGPLAPPSPMSQHGNMTPPTHYPCHVTLRPPPIAAHHITNDESNLTSGNPSSHSSSLGANHSAMGYEVLAYGLPPPHLPSSSSSSSNFTHSISTGANCTVTSHQSLETRHSPCNNNSIHLGGGSSSIYATETLSPSVPSYTHMSYNYATSTNNIPASGIANPPHGASGKQQFFASCFYSPWV